MKSPTSAKLIVAWYELTAEADLTVTLAMSSLLALGLTRDIPVIVKKKRGVFVGQHRNRIVNRLIKCSSHVRWHYMKYVL